MLFEAVFCGFWAIALVYIVCEFGQRFSDAFSNFNDALGQFHWYLLPIDVQRMLAIIIINAQQSVVVTCFGSISCERETFKKVTGAWCLFQVIDHNNKINDNETLIFQVVNKAYSYFIFLRNVYK